MSPSDFNAHARERGWRRRQGWGWVCPTHALPFSHLQRGDVVEVRFSTDFAYKGIVFSARKDRGVYVVAPGSGTLFRPCDPVTLTLVERRGRRASAEQILAWAAECA